jgi:RNA polymerase sigma factor (sigma-70 family)
LETITDNALMLKVKEGDAEKLGLLFKRYSKNLYGFYFHFTHQAALSEDLVQDVFIRMLRYRHTFRGDGKFITWMYHIARNVLSDHAKKKKRQGYTDDISEKEDYLPASSGTEEARQHEDDLRRLEAAFQLLSDDQKEILMLSRWQGLKYKEIAELLGCTEANVKIKVFRATNALREIFYKQPTKELSI